MAVLFQNTFLMNYCVDSFRFAIDPIAQSALIGLLQHQGVLPASIQP